MSKQLKGSLLLLLTAMIWGASFVAQSVSMDLIGPFTFQCIRSILGAAVLLPVIAVLDKINGTPARARTSEQRNNQRKAGLVCGAIFFIACNLQQLGMCTTSAGKAGFITAMYIVLVPIAGLFLKKKAGWNIWIGVTIALCGLYLLCITDGFRINTGDLLILLCAFAFTAHILAIDHFSPFVDGVRLSCTQFAVNAVLSGICMFLFESPSVDTILACALPIAYSGICSCGIAYTLQIIGQKYTRPTIASLLMSLESVFAVLFSWLLLDESLSAREGIGCVLMFAAIVLAQIPIRSKKCAAL